MCNIYKPRILLILNKYLTYAREKKIVVTRKYNMLGKTDPEFN